MRPTPPGSALFAAIYALLATLCIAGSVWFPTAAVALLAVSGGALLVLAHRRLQSCQASLDRALVELGRTDRSGSLGAAAQVVAHDIKNVCLVIDAAAHHLRRDPGVGVKSRSVLDDVSACSRRLASVARDLMQRTDRGPPNAAEVDVERVVADCVRLLDVMAPAGACDVAVSADEVAPVRVPGPDLEYALLNVLLNAVDANSGRGTIRVSLGTDQREVVVRVRDEGPGLAPEIADRVFEPFFTTKGEHASGIGLSASRTLLRQNGGDLRFCRVGEPGAEVELRLPRAS
jgi:signal transduction histidine kinase